MHKRKLVIIIISVILIITALTAIVIVSVTNNESSPRLIEITNSDDVNVNIPEQTFTGKRLTPSDFTVKYKDKETTFTIIGYGENINAGTKAGFIDIEFNGNYSGSRKIYFDIKQRDINNVEGLNLDSVTIPTQFYTGYELRPEIILPVLTLNTDYTLTYSNNVNYCIDLTSINAPKVTVRGCGNYTGYYNIPFAIDSTIDEDLVNKFDNEHPDVLSYVFNSLVNNSQSVNAAYSPDLRITNNQLLHAYQTLSMNYTATLNTLSREIGTVDGDDYASVKNATIVLVKAMFSQTIQVPGVVIRYDNYYKDVNSSNTTGYGLSNIGIARSLGIDFFASGRIYPENDVTAKQFAYILYYLNKAYGNYPTYKITRTNSTKVVNKLDIQPTSPLNNFYRMIVDNDTLSPLYDLSWDGISATPLISFGNTLFHYQQILSCLQNYANMIYEFYGVDVTFSFSPVFSAYSDGNFRIRLLVQVGESSSPTSLKKLFGQDYSFDDGGTVKTYASTGTPWLDKITEYKTADTDKYNKYKKYADVLTSTEFLMMSNGLTVLPEDVSSQSLFMEIGLFNITAIATQGN